MGKEYEWSPAILDTSPNNEETRNFRQTFNEFGRRNGAV